MMQQSKRSQRPPRQLPPRTQKDRSARTMGSEFQLISPGSDLSDPSSFFANGANDVPSIDDQPTLSMERIVVMENLPHPDRISKNRTHVLGNNAAAPVAPKEWKISKKELLKKKLVGCFSESAHRLDKMRAQTTNAVRQTSTAVKKAATVLMKKAMLPNKARQSPETELESKKREVVQWFTNDEDNKNNTTLGLLGSTKDSFFEALWRESNGGLPSTCADEDVAENTPTVALTKAFEEAVGLHRADDYFDRLAVGSQSPVVQRALDFSTKSYELGEETTASFSRMFSDISSDSFIGSVDASRADARVPRVSAVTGNGVESDEEPEPKVVEHVRPEPSPLLAQEESVDSVYLESAAKMNHAPALGLRTSPGTDKLVYSPESLRSESSTSIYASSAEKAEPVRRLSAGKPKHTSLELNGLHPSKELVYSPEISRNDGGSPLQLLGELVSLASEMSPSDHHGKKSCQSANSATSPMQDPEIICVQKEGVSMADPMSPTGYLGRQRITSFESAMSASQSLHDCESASITEEGISMTNQMSSTDCLGIKSRMLLDSQSIQDSPPVKEEHVSVANQMSPTEHIGNQRRISLESPSSESLSSQDSRSVSVNEEGVPATKQNMSPSEYVIDQHRILLESATSELTFSLYSRSVSVDEESVPTTNQRMSLTEHIGNQRRTSLESPTCESPSSQNSLSLSAVKETVSMSEPTSSVELPGKRCIKSQSAKPSPLLSNVSQIGHKTEGIVERQVLHENSIVKGTRWAHNPPSNSGMPVKRLALNSHSPCGKSLHVTESAPCVLETIDYRHLALSKRETERTSPDSHMHSERKATVEQMRPSHGNKKKSYSIWDHEGGDRLADTLEPATNQLAMTNPADDSMASSLGSSVPIVSHQALSNAAFLFSPSYVDGQNQLLFRANPPRELHSSTFSISTFQSRSRLSTVLARSRPVFSIPISSAPDMVSVKPRRSFYSDDDYAYRQAQRNISNGQSQKHVRFSNDNQCLVFRQPPRARVAMGTPETIVAPAIESKVSDLTDAEIPFASSSTTASILGHDVIQARCRSLREMKDYDAMEEVEAKADESPIKPVLKRSDREDDGAATPLRANSRPAHNSHLAPTNSPMIRFLEAKSKFSKPMARVPTRKSPPMKFTKPSSGNGAVLSRVTELNGRLRSNRQLERKNPRRDTGGHNVLAPRQATLVAPIFRNPNIMAYTASSDVKNNSDQDERFESQQSPYDGHDAADPDNGDDEIISDSCLSTVASVSGEDVSATAIESQQFPREEEQYESSSDSDDDDDAFAGILKQPRVDPSSVADSGPCQKYSGSKRVQSVNSREDIIDEQSSEEVQPRTLAHEGSLKMGTSLRSLLSEDPSALTLDSNKENSVARSMGPKCLSFSDKAQVNPREQRHHAPPGALCLSPLQRTPMQARKWRTLAAAAQEKDRVKKGSSKKPKGKGLKERNANVCSAGL